MTKKELHHKLKKALWSLEGVLLLKGRHYQWCDGGCGILAAAIHSWLGPSSVRVVVWAKGNSLCGTNNIGVQHVAVRVGKLYIDADGITLKRALLTRWREREHAISPSVEPLRNLADIRLIPSTTPELQAAILKFLQDNVGDGKAVYQALTAGLPCLV